MSKDIQTALDAIKTQLPERQLYCDYYAGNHNLAFATEKFKSAFGQTLKGMRDNLCPIVVDAVADRMEVINFAGDGTEKAVAEAAWGIWQRESMEMVSFDTHVEALKAGTAYLLVWPEENEAKFYLQDSRNCAVIEDEETAKPLFGAKQWKTSDEFVRLNLYYADRIEKYVTAKKLKAGQPLKAEHFKPTDEEPVVQNPYGVMPMFKFEANPVLADAIPMQDALNKTFADRMVTQEFASFRQRWATGLEPPTDELTGIQKKLFDGGADKLWFTNEASVKFGDFDVTPLEPFLKAADADRLEMARVTGTPLHFFSINTSDAISGKALKALESRFTKKVKRATINFGRVWASVMGLALQIEGNAAGTLTVQWESPETRDEAEFLETLGQKQDILEVPVDTLREEYGYTPEDIEKFNKAAEDEPDDVDPAVRAMAAIANGGTKAN